MVLAEGEPFISCPMTLEKELSERISKIERSRMGTVRGTTGTCANGFGVYIITLLPEAWTINYNSFSGTLPAITGLTVEIVNFSFLYAQIGQGSCLYKGNLHMSETVAGGSITTLRILEEFTFIPFRLLRGICPGRFILGGTQTLEPAQSIRLL